MLTREATYEDYGFSEEEDKKFNEFCRKLEMRDKILLLQCAAEVYPNVCDELYRKDFYAYRKKTLAVFREALQVCNRYPF